jgi:hypothetical protein
MITSPAAAVGLETLCEARMRAVSLVVLLLLQATKAKVVSPKTANKRAAFFKRRAPNCKKSEDFGAK